MMSELKRLTTDVPCGHLETMLNYAYVKDERAVLRYGDGEDDIDLCEYISRESAEKYCEHSAEEVMAGSCIECDCPFAILYVVATQAAELRERLKDIEGGNTVFSFPCAVGDLVYAIWSTPDKTRHVLYAAEVKKITLSKRNCRMTTTFAVEPIDYRGRIIEYREDDFGKFIFVRKEDADKALAEKESEVNNE